MLRVVLDANVFISDVWMEGTAFRIFRSSAPRLSATVYVPRVVVEEVVGWFSREVDQLVAGQKKAEVTWRRLHGPLRVTDLSIPESQTLIAQFKRELLFRLKSEQITVLDYPSVSHQVLVQRAVHRRRPFRDDGRGYRDALIWESILELLRKDRDSSLYFVTQNHRDFGEGPRPHPDLALDTSEIGIHDDRIEIVGSLEKLNAKVFVPHLSRLDDLFEQLRDPMSAWFSLTNWAKSELQKMINENEFAHSLLGLEHDHGGAWVSEIKAIDALEADDVRRVSPDELLVSATISFTAEISTRIDDSDYYRHKDIRDLWGTPPGGSATAWMEGSGVASVSLIVSSADHKLLSAELDEFEASDGNSWSINPHARRDD
jgi:hypothetical protein